MGIVDGGLGTGLGIETDGIGPKTAEYNAAVLGNDLDAISDISRWMVGIPTSKVDPDHAKDRYRLLWPDWISLSRDEILMDLAIAGHEMPVGEISLPMETGVYDLQRYGFVRVDMLAYGTEGSRIPIPIYSQPLRGVVESNDPDAQGTPYLAYLDGLTGVRVMRAPEDANVKLFVTGPRFPTEMFTATDLSNLPKYCNETIAAGAARRACQYDSFNLDMNAALPGIRETYERGLARIGLVLKKYVRQRAGIVLAPGLRSRYMRRQWRRL